MPVSGYRGSSRAVTHSNFTAWLCYKLISGLTLQVSSREQGVNDVNTNNLLQRSLLHKKTIRLNERLDTDRNISFQLFRTKTEQQYFCFVNKDDLYPFTDFLTSIFCTTKISLIHESIWWYLSYCYISTRIFLCTCVYRSSNQHRNLSSNLSLEEVSAMKFSIMRPVGHWDNPSHKHQIGKTHKRNTTSEQALWCMVQTSKGE